ncbi:hypothetical protein [Kineosporia sp. NBRC 101731]|uniref:hypothetical protein n=1 Tax=Kineosporia sp. NBRC 101731 TaxID=3032199 RepID=UPI0025530B25|nr:hypothetical protein [Kineosporia sp. NBRC 101731]
MGLTIGAGGSAHADVLEEPGDTAGGISEPNTWPDLSEPGAKEDRAQAEAKLALSEAIFVSATGTGSQARVSKSVAQMLADYQATFGTKALSEDTESALLEAARPGGSSTNSDGVSTRAVDAPERTISMAQYPQAKNYYCGPAAAQALLKAKNFGDSADSGLALTQANLARDEYLTTEKNDATTWASFRMRKGMNRWRGDTFFVELPSPSGSRFQSAVLTAVSGGHGGTVDAVEYAGGLHYNNHPSDRTIGHWTAIYGHTADVVSVKLVDPSASDSVSWGHLPAEKFRYNTKQFADNFLEANGMVY